MRSKAHPTLLLAPIAAALVAALPVRLHAGFVPVQSVVRYWLCGGARTTWDDLLRCNEARCDEYRSDSFQAMREKCEPLLRLYESKQCITKEETPDPGSSSPGNPPKNPTPTDKQDDGRGASPLPPPAGTTPAAPPAPNTPSGGSEPPANSHQPLPSCAPATS